MMAVLPSSVNAALDRVKSVAAVRQVILYGSRAMGDEDERSDVDIAISAPDLDSRDFAILRDAIANARTLYTISLARLEEMPASLRDRVLTQGRVLYERS